jgi:hypothetical protein
LAQNLKTQFYKKRRKIELFYTLSVFSIFRIEGSLEKIQGTHILARLEILYRMAYKTSTNKTFAATLLSVHPVAARAGNVWRKGTPLCFLITTFSDFRRK